MSMPPGSRSQCPEEEEGSGLLGKSHDCRWRNHVCRQRNHACRQRSRGCRQRTAAAGRNYPARLLLPSRMNAARAANKPRRSVAASQQA